jgi:hypothetical protein
MFLRFPGLSQVWKLSRFQDLKCAVGTQTIDVYRLSPWILVLFLFSLLLSTLTRRRKIVKGDPVEKLLHGTRMTSFNDEEI